MYNQVNWDILNISFKMVFVFKIVVEIRGFKEFQEVWYDVVGDIYFVKCFEGQCQVIVEVFYNDVEQ